MRKNVLYLVLDCLRSDVISPEITPAISRLKEKNPSFESCITTANWSLPSHASIFTGEYPHNHHIYNNGHTIESLPLVQSFADRGYRTVGLTSNAYFNAYNGFACDFDAFYDVNHDIDLAGLDPLSAYNTRDSDNSKILNYANVLADVITHPRPLISFKNYLKTIRTKIGSQPSTDENYGSLTRSSERSVAKLFDLFNQQAGENRPFFAFVNFMDTHTPYEPPQHCLDAISDGTYKTDDLELLDPDISNPFTFLNEHYNGGVNQNSVETVRTAYRAEAHSVDQRIAQILNGLEKNNIREDTIIVITADHGEVLGETDLRNENSMGHMDSLSKHLWNVPLIIANPDLPAETVDSPFSLRRLSDVLIEQGIQWADSGSVEWAYDDPQPILFELPTNTRYNEWDTYEKYESIPDWYSRRHTVTHTVFGIDGKWSVAAESNGTVTAWLGEKEQDENKAPSDLVSACTSAVESFPDEKAIGSTQQISDERRKQLERLGYR